MAQARRLGIAGLFLLLFTLVSFSNSNPYLFIATSSAIRLDISLYGPNHTEREKNGSFDNEHRRAKKSAKTQTHGVSVHYSHLSPL